MKYIQAAGIIAYQLGYIIDNKMESVQTVQQLCVK